MPPLETADAGDLEAALLSRVAGAAQKTGIAKRLKSELRFRLIESLHGGGGKKGADGSGIVVSGPSPPLAERAVFSLVLELLKAKGRHYSLSVLLPESGMAATDVLTPEEAVQALSLQRVPLVAECAASQTAEGEPAFLERLLSALGSLERPLCSSQGSQTDGGPLGQSLDAKLQACAVSAEAAARGRRRVDERLLQFEAQCEARCRKEADAEIARVRTLERERVALEEAAKCRAEFQEAAVRLEREAREREKRLREKEAAALERLRSKELELERQAVEWRAAAQRAIEDGAQRQGARSRQLGVEEQRLGLQAHAFERRDAELKAREQRLAAEEAALEAKLELQVKGARAELEGALAADREDLRRRELAAERGLLELERERERRAGLEQKLGEAERAVAEGGLAARRAEEASATHRLDLEESRRQLRVLTEAGQQSQLASDRLRAQVEALQASRGAAEHAEEVRQQAVDVLDGQVRLLQTENGRLLSEVESLRGALRGREADQDEGGRQARQAWQLERQSLQEEIDRLKRHRVEDDVARRHVQEEWLGLRDELRRAEDQRGRRAEDEMRRSLEFRRSFDPSLRELQELEEALMQQEEEDLLGGQASLLQPRRRGPETAARARLAEETRRLRHRIGEFAARQYLPGLSSLGDVPGDWAGGLELGGLADLAELPSLAELPGLAELSTAPAAGSRQQQGSAPVQAASISGWQPQAGVRPLKAQPAPLLVEPPAAPSASPPVQVPPTPARRPGMLADDYAQVAGGQHGACARGGAAQAAGSAERPLRLDGLLAEGSAESSRGRGPAGVRGGDAALAQPVPSPVGPPAALSACPPAQVPPALARRPADGVLADESAGRARGQHAHGGAAQAADAADRPLRSDGAIVEDSAESGGVRGLAGARGGHVAPAAGVAERPFDGTLAEDSVTSAGEQQPGASPAGARGGAAASAAGAAERPFDGTLEEPRRGTSPASARGGGAAPAAVAPGRRIDDLFAEDSVESVEEHQPGASPTSARDGGGAAAAGAAGRRIDDLFAEESVESVEEYQPGASPPSARDGGGAAAAGAAGRRIDDLFAEESVESVGEQQPGASSPGGARGGGAAPAAGAAGRRVDDLFADEPSEDADARPAAVSVGAAFSPLASEDGAASSRGSAASPRPLGGGAGRAVGARGGGDAEAAQQRPLQDTFGHDSDGDDAAAAALATASAALSQAPGRQPTPKCDVGAGLLGEFHRHQDSPFPRAKQAPGSPPSARSRPTADEDDDEDEDEESSSAGSLPSLPMGAAPARGSASSSGSVHIGANAGSGGASASGASAPRHASPPRSAGAGSGSRSRGGTESSPALSIPGLGLESDQGERRPLSDDDFVLTVEVEIAAEWCIGSGDRSSTWKDSVTGTMSRTWEEFQLLEEMSASNRWRAEDTLRILDNKADSWKSQEGVKASRQHFLREVLKCHPDKGGDPESFRALMKSRGRV